MTKVNLNEWVPKPASSAHLDYIIELAAQHLEDYRKSECDSLDITYSNYVALWKDLLTQSNRVEGNVAPYIKRYKLDSKTKFKIDKRNWQRFINWFNHEIQPKLSEVYAKKDLPMIYPARSSNTRGGYYMNNQALYYLTFEFSPPCYSDDKKNRPSPEIFSEEGALHQITSESIFRLLPFIFFIVFIILLPTLMNILYSEYRDLQEDSNTYLLEQLTQLAEGLKEFLDDNIKL